MDYRTGQQVTRSLKNDSIRESENCADGTERCDCGSTVDTHRLVISPEMPNPKEQSLEEVSRFKLLADPVKDAWAHPVLCSARLYLRYHDQLWCFDVKERN